jgi:uncharacterized glyoxalase superfamily protein PhnB
MERLNDSSGTLKHAELLLGDSKIMVGQASEQYKPRPQTLYVYLPDVDATYKRAMSAGATSLQEVTDQFYGDRTGGFEDTAGNWWYIATHTEDITMEEMQRRLNAQNIQP